MEQPEFARARSSLRADGVLPYRPPSAHRVVPPDQVVAGFAPFPSASALRKTAHRQHWSWPRSSRVEPSMRMMPTTAASITSSRPTTM